MNANAGDGRPAGRRLILFGAFDRHNFGDLLLAHCAAAAHPGREPLFAGLAARDLSPFGGHRVRALAEVVAAHRGEVADFVHVGGEILTTTAWEAAVMLQSPTEAARAIALHERNPDARRAWAQAALGTARRIPYAVPADDLPAGWTTHFNAVGGVALEALPDAERTEVLESLRQAASVAVRDAATHAALRRAGIGAALAPDPASATRRLFGTAVAARARAGEVATLARRMPGWIAVQLAAQWGDDAALDRLADSLGKGAARMGAGIALFRAGLAPWHDDRATLERLAARIGAAIPVAILDSAHVLDICALLATARAYLGTSLHGWIVADSFGGPAHCLVEHAGDKAAVYLDTWRPSPRRWRTLADEELLPPARDA